MSGTIVYETPCMDRIFFDTWESLMRTAIIGVAAYLGLVLMLRLVGNRTLSQLNAFDLVVTVALGSTLATVILNKDVPLAEGLLALFLLVLLQLLISKLSLNTQVVRKIIKTEPRLIFFKGRYLKNALEKCRVTEDEILQVIRSEGIGSMKEVDAIVLESNGKFSVIRNVNEKEGSVLQNLA